MPEELTTAEEQVREFWPGSLCSKGRILAKQRNGAEWILSGNPHIKMTDAEAWTAALDFTDQYKLKIAECSNALQWIRVAVTTTIVVDGYRNSQQSAIDYTRKLLEARLADLKRGTAMEEKVDGK